MEKLFTYIGADDQPVRVRAADDDAWKKEQQDAGNSIRPAKVYLDADRKPVHVLEEDAQAFELESKASGRQIERANPVLVGGEPIIVGDSERNAFRAEYMKNPKYAADRAETRRRAEASAKSPKQNVMVAAVRGAGAGAVMGLEDASVSLTKGLVAVPQLAAGLADIAIATSPLALAARAAGVPLPKGGMVGRTLERVVPLADTQEGLRQQYSPEQQEAFKAVSEAGAGKGVLGKAAAQAGQIVRHPTVIAHGALESLPAMGVGGAIGRFISPALAAAGMSPATAAMTAGGMGEGIVAAGSAQEQIRAASPGGATTQRQTALAVGSGILTAGIGVLANRLAGSSVGRRLGLGAADIDTMLAGGGNGAAPGGLLHRLFAATVQEGLLEELPQSAQEQIMQNLATGRPWEEGVTEAAVTGAAIGAAMGMGADVSRPASQGQAKQPPQLPTVPKTAQKPSANPEQAAVDALTAPMSPVAGPEPVGAVVGQGVGQNPALTQGEAIQNADGTQTLAFPNAPPVVQWLAFPNAPPAVQPVADAPVAPVEAPVAPPPVAPMDQPPAKKVDREQVHAMNEAEASKQLGWNIHRKQKVLIMTTARGVPYKTPKSATVIAVQGGGLVRVSFRAGKDTSQTSQDISIERLAQTPQARGTSARTQKLSNLSQEDKKLIVAAERAVKKLLKETLVFSDGDYEDEIERTSNKKARSIAESKYAIWKLTNLAKMAGIQDFDPKDPVQIAGLLDKAKEIAASGNISVAKYMPPADVDPDILHDRDIVWSDGEWHMVSKICGGDVTQLKNGHTTTFEPGENANVQGVLREGEPGYDQAFEEYRQQEKRLRAEEEMRVAHENEQERPEEELAAQTEPTPGEVSPELMTPDEFQSEKASESQKVSASGKRTGGKKSVEMRQRIHSAEIYDSIGKQRPVSAIAVDAYGIDLPSGYVRDGDRYVFNPAAAAPAQARNDGSLFPESDIPFNLDGGEQPNVVRIAAEQQAEIDRQAEAQRQLDAAPMIPGIVRPPPAEMKAAPLTELERIKNGTKTIGDTAKEKAPAESVVSIVDSFLKTLPAMAAAKARAALGVSMMRNGMPQTRQEIVEDMVAGGATVVAHAKDGRRLQKPDGAFIEEKRLTKTGMDYAKYLQNQQPAELKAAGGGGPRGPAPTVPPWALDPAETKTGGKLVIRTTKLKAGMRDIIKFLNDAVGADMRFSKSQTSKRYPANYRPLGNLIFTRDSQSQINYHEAGHGLTQLMETRFPGIFGPMEARLEDITTWPDSMASANNLHEGVAEWVRLKVTDPAKLEGTSIDEAMTAAVNKVLPKTAQALRDAARAMHKFNELSVAQRWKMFTQENREAPSAKEAVDSFFRAGKAISEQLASGAPVSRVTRGIMRAIIRNLDKTFSTRQLAIAKARKVRAAHLNPVLHAYNYILSVNSEVANAMVGKGPMRGLRILGRDGKLRVVLNETWREIINRVKAAQWEQFEQAGWAAESLSRYEQDGYEYPGMRDGITPTDLKAIVDQAKTDIPDFQARFDDVQRWFDALLDIRDMGGLKKAGEVEKMRRRGSYWPMPRVMNKPGMSKGSNGAVDTQSGDFRAHGSGEQIRSLNEVALETTSETLNNYAVNQFKLEIVDHLRAVAGDTSLPQVARDIAGREFVRMKLPQKKVAALTREEAQQLIYDYMLEQESGRTGETTEELKTRIPRDSVNVSWDFKDLFRPTKPGDLNVISLLRNGEREYYQVGNDGMYNMFAQRGRPVHKILKAIDWAIGPATQNIKRMITQLTVFGANNLLGRDLINQMLLNPDTQGFIPFGVTLKGIVNRFTKKYPQAIQDGELLSRSPRSEIETLNKLREGAVWQFMTEGLYISQDKDPTMRLLKTVLQPSNWLFPAWKIGDVINFVTAGRWLSQGGESWAREGGAVEVLQRGGTDAEAMDAYWRNTARFNEGPVNPNVRIIMGWAMFLNPGIMATRQGLQNLTDPDPAIAGRAWVKLLIEIPALFTFAALIRYKMMDDKDKEKERERPFYDKMNYHDVGGFRLAFPNGIDGAMASLVYTATMDYLLDRPKDEALKTMKMLARNTFTLGEPFRFFGPQVATLIESEYNWSGFQQKHIISTWTEKLPTSEQSELGTPSFYKELGKWMDYSPSKLEYIAQQAISRQVDEILRLVDNPETLTNPQERADIPFIGRLFIRNPTGFGSASVDRLGDIKDRMMLLDRKLNAAGLGYLNDTSQKARNRPVPVHLAGLKLQLSTLGILRFASTRMQDYSKMVRLAHERKDFDQETNLKTAMVQIAQAALAANPEAVERIDTALRLIKRIQDDSGQ